MGAGGRGQGAGGEGLRERGREELRAQGAGLRVKPLNSPPWRGRGWVKSAGGKERGSEGARERGGETLPIGRSADFNLRYSAKNSAEICEKQEHRAQRVFLL